MERWNADAALPAPTPGRIRMASQAAAEPTLALGAGATPSSESVVGHMQVLTTHSVLYDRDRQVQYVVDRGWI